MWSIEPLLCLLWTNQSSRDVNVAIMSLTTSRPPPPTICLQPGSIIWMVITCLTPSPGLQPATFREARVNADSLWTRNRRHWDRVWWDSLLMAPHVWVDPSGSKWILALVSYDSKRDMCSRVQLIFKNHPDLYVPINPIFIYKIRCNDSISDTTFKVQCTRTHVPWVRTKKT